MQGWLFGSKLSIAQIFFVLPECLGMFPKSVRAEHSAVLLYFLFNNRVQACRDGGSSSTIPSVPLGVMELWLMCELSRLGPFGDSLLPLTRLCGLARSCISIDLTRHTRPHQIQLHISLNAPLMLNGNKTASQIVPDSLLLFVAIF